MNLEMKNSKDLLRVDGVCKSFGKMLAVNKCSLNVTKGTITALIGPNGAGKTTLFNLISGFHKPNKGKVFLNGDRIDGLRPDKIFHKGLIRTFQISRELEKMTLLENLMLIPAHQSGEWIWNTWFRPWRVKDQERNIKEHALETLNFVELYHLKDEYAENISTGQKRLLEIARTMMADPDIILLDEPGAGVNPTLMNKLIGYIQQLNDQGKTFFIVEHNMDLVMTICDPIIVMNAGSILTQGAPQQIRNDKRVIDAYLGD
jgi:branched-chain amino acid transport system ATP-binding protein